MEQAEKMCDRIAIIARGEKVVDGRLADIRSEAGGRHVALSFHRNQEGAARVLADRALVTPGGRLRRQRRGGAGGGRGER